MDNNISNVSQFNAHPAHKNWGSWSKSMRGQVHPPQLCSVSNRRIEETESIFLSFSCCIYLIYIPRQIPPPAMTSTVECLNSTKLGRIPTSRSAMENTGNGDAAIPSTASGEFELELGLSTKHKHHLWGSVFNEMMRRAMKTKTKAKYSIEKLNERKTEKKWITELKCNGE